MFEMLCLLAVVGTTACIWAQREEEKSRERFNQEWASLSKQLEEE